MSMNLCFKTKQCGHHIEFPYQTSTDTTYAVLAKKTKQEQLEEIRKDDIYNFCIAEWTKKEVDRMMLDETLELTMI